MPHADDGQLHAYLDGERRWLNDDPAALERHLEGCAACQRRLEEARRLRELGRSLLRSQLPVEHPPFEAVLARARTGSGHAVRRRVPAAVWAATVVLALAGGWLARGLVSGGSPAANGGGGVRISSAPASAPAIPVPAGHPAAHEAGTRSPAADATAPEPSKGTPIVAEAQSAEPQAPAGSVPPAAGEDASGPLSEPVRLVTREGGSKPAREVDSPAATGVESETLAGSAPSSAQLGESELLVAQVSPANDDGGAIGMIEGRVTDESGRVIPGAVVQVRELGVGTVTGPDGTYSLVVPETGAGTSNGRLIVTAGALGWESAAEPLTPASGGAITRDFLLRPAQVALEGVVAVGLGAVHRTPRDAMAGDDADAAGWNRAEREEVRRVLGRDALRIAGMPVLDTTIAQVDGMRIVRVRQELPGGAVATLLQWPEPGTGDAMSTAAAVTDRLSRALADGVEAKATASRDGLRIVAYAPISADSLTKLLENLW